MSVRSLSRILAGTCCALFWSCFFSTLSACGQVPGLDKLDRLESGHTKAENALWIENPLSARFNTSKRVIVADIKGPAEITMIHFAVPASQVGDPIRKLDRELAIQMFWDGEATPSVNVPLVDFFGDPAGLREEVNTALVNKRRGFNCYFPMPFRSSAKVELVYDGPVSPGESLWRIMPCYSYVMYRTLDKVGDDRGYFHAAWRQETLLLGQRDYLALEAKGRGKFVGWNATVRLPGRPGYPVDQNEKFFIDGEDKPSIEFQGMEDSFGFSWGFPPTESQFPLTGFFPFQKGAAAYRFFVPDAITFEKSLRVAIGFGEHEDPMFRREFSRRGNALQFSSTVYWYQSEPHAPQPALPPVTERTPAPEQPFWPDKELGAAASSLSSDDAYIRCRNGRWVMGTATVEKAVAVLNGRFVLGSFKNKISGREMVPAGLALDELSEAVVGVRGAGPWKLESARVDKRNQGELHLELKFSRGQIAVTKNYMIYPRTSVIREWMTIKNTGEAPLRLIEPRFLNAAARLGAGPGTLDFHWMTGAENQPGCWVLKTEHLAPESPRRFDSYDPFPAAGGRSPGGDGAAGLSHQGGHRMASSSYAPWYALFDRQSRDGLIIGWDYMGHWASSFTIRSDGTVMTALQVAGHKQSLQAGGSVTTPKTFVALYRDDLDNAGNELLDWQYRYLWDYTREGWFPAVPMLGYWYKGTGWGQPGVSWVGGQGDLPSQFTKVFRAVDLMRTVGGDVYHRDWGWWDRAGDWNGPDFGTTNKYLQKYGMRQLVYAFLYTVDRRSKVAREHPDWLLGDTLDMSKPEVVAHIKGQLQTFHDRWGDFAWRNDSTPTAPRDGDDTVLLAQDQGFREIVRSFLDTYPRSSFQAVNGGGNEAGYDYVRLSSMLQFSDAAIGVLRNYYASLLFPPDKLEDNGDAWNPDHYDKATWRGLLCIAIMTTGDTWDKTKLEGLRQLFDIYHYLAAQGVVGRWVKVYRPKVEGDDPTMYFERLSGDHLRGLIIPKRPAPSSVKIYPKGLLPDARYVITFQESAAETECTGAGLMSQGLVIDRMPPGELIYLNLPLHPGSKRDHQPPTAPGNVAKRSAENMGNPGIELLWSPGTDNNWISYYEILRNGQAIDKLAKGTFYFDHSAGADLAARYQVRAVDGAGNPSPPAQAMGPIVQPATVCDDEDRALGYRGVWQHQGGLQPAHAETISSARDRGAALELVFEGKRILWFSKLGGNCGRADVSIDGGSPQIVDTYCSDDVWGVCVFRTELAKPGKHTIRITVRGDHNPRATDSLVFIDGLRAESVSPNNPSRPGP